MWEFDPDNMSNNRFVLTEWAHKVISIEDFDTPDLIAIAQDGLAGFSKLTQKTERDIVEDAVKSVTNLLFASDFIMKCESNGTIESLYTEVSKALIMVARSLLDGEKPEKISAETDYEECARRLIKREIGENINNDMSQLISGLLNNISNYGTKAFDIEFGESEDEILLKALNIEESELYAITDIEKSSIAESLDRALKKVSKTLWR